MAAPGVLIPAPLVVQLKPWLEPCCPVVGFWAGLVGGPAPNTTPADGSSRQAPIVREANRCFISALPSKLCCALETVVWRRYAERIGQRSNVRIAHRRPGGRARSLQTKHRKGAKNPELSRFFLSHPPSCPSIFSDCGGPNSARGIGVKRCALRKSAAIEI